MAEKYEAPVLDFKRGDDLKLDFTVQDTNTTEAISQLTALTTAQALLEELQTDNSVEQTAIEAQQVIVDNLQSTYDDLITIDITGWVIRSQIRRGKKLIDNLEVLIVDSLNGTFEISKNHIFTQNWDLASLEVDIQFDTLSNRISSETFIIKVLRDITL